MPASSCPVPVGSRAKELGAPAWPASGLLDGLDGEQILWIAPPALQHLQGGVPGHLVVEAERTAEVYGAAAGARTRPARQPLYSGELLARQAQRPRNHRDAVAADLIEQPVDEGEAQLGGLREHRLEHRQFY